MVQGWLVQFVLFLAFSCSHGQKPILPDLPSSIDDIIQENARQRADIKWLNDFITNNITELIRNMDHHSDQISLLEKDMDQQSDQISDVESDVAIHSKDIATNTA